MHPVIGKLGTAPLCTILLGQNKLCHFVSSFAEKLHTGCHTLPARNFLRNRKLSFRIAGKADYQWKIVGSNKSAIMIQSKEKVKADFESRILSYFWSKMWAQILILRDSRLTFNQIFPAEPNRDISTMFQPFFMMRDANNFEKKELPIPIVHHHGDKAHGKRPGSKYCCREQDNGRICIHPWEKLKLNIQLQSKMEKEASDCFFGHLVLRFSRNCTRNKGTPLDPEWIGFCKRPVATLTKKIHRSLFVFQKTNSISIGLPSVYIITADFFVYSQNNCTDTSLHYIWKDYKRNHSDVFMSFFDENKQHYSWEEAAKFCKEKELDLPSIHSQKDAENLLTLVNNQQHKIIVFKKYVFGTTLIFIGLWNKVSHFTFFSQI